MASPTVDRFLAEIAQILQARDKKKLHSFLQIEPPLPQPYLVLADELRRVFPRDNHDRLEGKISSQLPAQEDGDAAGGSWPAFVTFLAHYFGFLRDVNPDQLLEAYEEMKSLLK